MENNVIFVKECKLCYDCIFHISNGFQDMGFSCATCRLHAYIYNIPFGNLLSFVKFDLRSDNCPLLDAFPEYKKIYDMFKK